MDNAEFKTLCRATCVALHCKDPEALAKTGTVEVDGVQVGLFFDGHAAPDRIICYLDIGPLSPFGREEILSRLLAINLITGTKTAGVYALDRETDNVIFVQHFMYPDLLEAEEFAAILKDYAVHANSLRKTLLEPLATQPLSDMLSQSLEQRSALLA